MNLGMKSSPSHIEPLLCSSEGPTVYTGQRSRPRRSLGNVVRRVLVSEAANVDRG
jgi:hypothetical protein